MKEDTEYKLERQRMVEEQFLSRDITDPRVLEAMLSVPRHVFVPEEHQAAGIPGQSTADRPVTNHLATLYRGFNDTDAGLRRS